MATHVVDLTTTAARDMAHFQSGKPVHLSLGRRSRAAPGDVVLCREPWAAIDATSGYPTDAPAEDLTPDNAFIALDAHASEFERELVEERGGTWRAPASMPDWAVAIRVTVTTVGMRGCDVVVVGTLAFT